MNAPVRQAMLLAAGLGIRMRPLTDETAKPMLRLAGRPLLDHALDRLVAAGVERVVVNLHWRAEIVRAHLRHRPAPPEIILRHEESLLETGGAIRAALTDGALAPEPFFIINGDAFWLDGPTPALNRLKHRFDPAQTDARLLLHRTFQVHAETGPGDFALDPWLTPRRRREREIVPYIFAGVQLATPALFADTPEGRFSTNLVWDRALAANRLQAFVHDGLWFHLSTPADLAEAEIRLAAAETSVTT